MQITNNPLNFKDKSILFLKDLITFGSRHRVNEWYLNKTTGNCWEQGAFESMATITVT